MVESVADLLFRVVVVLAILAGWLWIVGGWVVRWLRQRREAATAAGEDPGSSGAAS